jgi:putative hemolysin
VLAGSSVRFFAQKGNPVGNPVLEVFIILALLVANGVFAMSEIAIVSARKARLQQLAEEGNASAQTALDLATNPNQFLSTIQIGITLIGILAGAFGGATLAESIALGLATIPALAPYSEVIGVGIVVITYLSLIIGELVPKRVALNNPERIAASVAGPMNALSRVASPIVRMLSGSTDVVIRLLGIKPSDEPAVTEEEVKVLIEQGTQVGVFQPVEQDMIEGVLRLGERSVGAVMTPRTQIVWIDLEDLAEEIYRKVVGSHHSRFPVARESLDNFLGIILAKDLLAQHWQGQPLDLKSLLREPLFVPESMPALRLLELFKKKGTHVAMVLDEYGGVQGMITHNDILEDIAGYASTPGAPEPQAVRREDGSWLVDGLLHIDRLKEIFDLDELPREELSLYQTVGGFVVDRFGNIPSVGQSFAWEGLRFEVVDMDAHRVDKVLVQKAKTE